MTDEVRAAPNHGRRTRRWRERELLLPAGSSSISIVRSRRTGRDTGGISAQLADPAQWSEGRLDAAVLLFAIKEKQQAPPLIWGTVPWHAAVDLGLGANNLPLRCTTAKDTQNPSRHVKTLPFRSRLPCLTGLCGLHVWIPVTPAVRGTRQIRSASPCDAPSLAARRRPPASHHLLPPVRR